MSKPVKPIPDGYSAVTPYITIKNAAAAIEFYKKAFGAEEALRLNAPDGTVAHAEIRIGGAVIMLSEESPQWDALSPDTIGGTASSIMLYVKDADAVFKRAVAAGATVTRDIADQFYGRRDANLLDPFGYPWSVFTVKEEMPVEEMHRRFRAMMPEKKKPAVDPVPKGDTTLTTPLSIVTSMPSPPNSPRVWTCMSL